MNLLKASKESDLVVDAAATGVWADDERRHRMPYPLPSTRGRRDVVVEAAPVVPRQEDRGAVPVRAAHHGVDQRGHVALPGRRRRGRVLGVDLVGTTQDTFGRCPPRRGRGSARRP
jgi:hypothetical protein